MSCVPSLLSDIMIYEKTTEKGCNFFSHINGPVANSLFLWQNLPIQCACPEEQGMPGRSYDPRVSTLKMVCFIFPVVSVRADIGTHTFSTFPGQRLTWYKRFHHHGFENERRRLPLVRCSPQAKQSLTEPDADNFSFDADDDGGETATPPVDFGAELEKTLQQLGEKMSQLPVPSQEDAVEKQPVPDTENSYEQILFHAAKQINNLPEESEEQWTFEERALYSVVSGYNDQSSDGDFDSTDTYFSALSSSLEDPRTAESRKSQANPIEINRDVQSRLNMLKKRRQRLASQRGEDTFKELRSLAREEDENNELDFLQNRDRKNMKNLVRFSLRGARVIDLREMPSEPCELTAGAGHHFREAWRVPLSYRPFLGIQDAFKRLDNPPCPRCRRRKPKDQLKNINSLCDDCYSRIYVQTPVGSESTDPSLGYGPWISKELKEEERKLADAAEQVALSLSRGSFLPRHPVMTSGDEVTEDSRTGDSVQERRGASEPSMATDLNTGSKFNMNGSGGPPKRRRRSGGGGWNVRASERSLRTINPIRNLVQNIDVSPNPSKELIRLSVGDPTVYGNLSVSQQAIDKFCEVVRSGRANGYSMSMGGEAAREAVAQRYTSDRSPLRKEDVVLTAGTSGALELALGAIANEGDNVLLPRPGFPLFRTIAEGYGIECRYYEVDPDKNWEIKLRYLTSLADDRTRAVVVNNPSNPCGSVYSANHIEDLLAVASVLKLPIITDEVYADMVFSDETFTPIGVASVDVPVLSVGGMSKQFVVPGWRLGWVLIHDRNKIFEKGEVRRGMRQLTTRMLVPNTPTQHVLPTMLKLGMGTLMKDLETNAEFTMQCLKDTKGLRVIKPQGAMYAMVEIDSDRLGLEDDMDFVRQLLAEEAVFVLPGQCFQAKNFVRIVFSAPKDVLAEAFSRMNAFCERRCR